MHNDINVLIDYNSIESRMHGRRKIEELNFKMVIIIDTREQLPYSFDVPSEVATVPVGDYSIAGLEHRIGIERKELNDLIGCLCKGREKFGRKIEKRYAEMDLRLRKLNPG